MDRLQAADRFVSDYLMVEEYDLHTWEYGNIALNTEKISLYKREVAYVQMNTYMLGQAGVLNLVKDSVDSVDNNCARSSVGNCRYNFGAESS